MGVKERKELIKKIEEIRSSHVLCYLTSLRPNVPAQMAQDSVRVIFDHLLHLPKRKVEKLDVFLVSNGGESTVPWRLTALFREFANSFNVLIPFRAYSAATLLALGADEIVMHPFGELGPIDPTVANDFNPTNAQGQQIGISVEDVKSYIAFVKNTVGVEDKSELLKAVEFLMQKVHPLAIGNVERFISQSRMIARKIMQTHMEKVNEAAIDEIVENMASKLYFHGHPINRQEAKKDLNLKIQIDLPESLEETMWNLYLDFEAEFKNREEYVPLEDAINANQGLPKAGGTPVTRRTELVHVMVESCALTSKYTSSRRTVLSVEAPDTLKLIEEVHSRKWQTLPSA